MADLESARAVPRFSEPAETMYKLGEGQVKSTGILRYEIEVDDLIKATVNQTIARVQLELSHHLGITHPARLAVDKLRND